MDERELQQLVTLFSRSGLQVLEVEQDPAGGWRVRMEQRGDGADSMPHRNEPETAGEAVAPVPQPAPAVQAGTVAVKAPVVGVVYVAPAPDAAPFVTVGQQVKEGQVLCLLEAMKLMNELKAPAGGIITAIHVENGVLAEYGQVLYEITTADDAAQKPQ